MFAGWNGVILAIVPSGAKVVAYVAPGTVASKSGVAVADVGWLGKVAVIGDG